MHNSMVSISFLSVAVKFISSEYGPMLFISVGFSLEIALSLKNSILMSLNFAETLEWLNNLLRWIIFLIKIVDTFFGIHIYHGFVQYFMITTSNNIRGRIAHLQISILFLSLIRQTYPYTKCFLRVYGWELSLQFLHVLIRNAYRLFWFLVSSHFMSSC